MQNWNAPALLKEPQRTLSARCLPTRFEPRAIGITVTANSIFRLYRNSNARNSIKNQRKLQRVAREVLAFAFRLINRSIRRHRWRDSSTVLRFDANFDHRIVASIVIVAAKRAFIEAISVQVDRSQRGQQRSRLAKWGTKRNSVSQNRSVFGRMRVESKSPEDRESTIDFDRVFDAYRSRYRFVRVGHRHLTRINS